MRDLTSAPCSWRVIMCLCLCAASPCRSAEASPERAQDTQAQPQLTPPRVLSRVDARYPQEALARGRGGQVQLTVVVLRDGTVGEVLVSASAGPELDQAAVVAVRQWRFIPAQRGAQAVASKIRVPFSFTPPPAPAPLAPSPAEPELSPEEEAIEVTVRGERASRAERRSASDFSVSRDQLAAAPKQEGAEVLRAAPGLYIGRGEGLAVAHSYMLRGFDAEHGQDIEFKLGGLPINLPSHIHGQGYSDLGFLIGDVVQTLKVSEGVYDPRQGDFAVAGSLALSLGVTEQERGVKLRTSYGAFDSGKQTIIWAPEGMGEESFVAAQLSSTGGFGEQRAGRGGSAILQHRFGQGELTHRLIAVIYAARAQLAGVLRYDDVTAAEGGVARGEGRCWLCSYPYPTAQAQNALANRLITGVFSDYQGEGGENGQLGLWVSYDHFRAQNNFTGFTQSSQRLERVAGRGDLIEQQSHTLSLGLTSRYRARPRRPTSWAVGSLELGVDGRVDELEQSQNLLDASVRNQVWDQRVDASIKGADLGLWGDLDWALFDRLQARAGLRADLLSYSVEDRLSNLPPLNRPQADFISGYRRSALGLAWGPRASLEWRFTSALSGMLAYGEGYRSPQARMLSDGDEAPYTKVSSADLGLRFQPSEALQLTVGGYRTRLSDDVSFEAEEGRLERVGATERLGGVFNLVTRPTSWFVGALSVTYVDATLLEPPPATAEEPQPPFSEGQRLPFVPPLVMRLDLSAQRPLPVKISGEPVMMKGGVGYSYLSPRSLTYNERSRAVSLLDLSLQASWGPLELSFELFNSLNLSYAALEYVYPSDWDPSDGVRPRTPARHLSAGAPRTWMSSLGIKL